MIINPYIFGGFDPDAQAFITAANITDNTQRTAINQLVVDLKGYGIWSKMKAIYPFVGGTASTHKWNLKDPRDLDAAFRLVFNGGWTHSSTGALPNGTNGYADTYLIPSVSLTASNGHISVYLRTNIAEDKYDIGVFVNNIDNMIASRFSNNLFIVNYGNSTYPSISNIDSRGYYITNRNSTTNTTGYKNSIKIIDSIQTGGVASNQLYLGALNLNNSATVFSSKQVAFATIGDGLTDTDATNLYNTVQTFQTSLSRQV